MSTTRLQIAEHKIDLLTRERDGYEMALRKILKVNMDTDGSITMRKIAREALMGERI